MIREAPGGNPWVMTRLSIGVLASVGALLCGCQVDVDASEGDSPPNGLDGRGQIAARSGPSAAPIPESCQDTPDTGLCCEAGQITIQGTALDDVLDQSGSTDAHCVFGLPGADQVSMGPAGGRALLGSGNDVFIGGAGADLVLAGAGNDTLSGGAGNDDLWGEEGDDVINGGAGDDFIVPGPGADVVDAGLGDDTVVIHHLCEVEAGERLDGSRGNDLLVIPVPIAELIAAGVTVDGFEQVVVEPDPCGSTCAEQPDCGEHGVCTAGPDGEAACACDEGHTGPECDIPCEAGQSCELKLFVHGNGSINGALMRGGVLFEATDEAEVEAGLKQWLATHHEIVQLDEIELLDVLDELVPAEPSFRERGNLRTLQFRQTYRSHRIYGPEEQMTATLAPGRGVISWMGTVADPREDYSGLVDPITEAMAEAAILARWQELGDETNDVVVTDLELVAVPQAKAMGWYANIEGPTLPSGPAPQRFGHVVVPAARNLAGGPLGFALGYGLARHGSPDQMQNIQVLGSPFTDDAKEDTETALWSALPTGGALLGSAHTPGGVFSGVKLGNSLVQLYDAQGLEAGVAPAPIVNAAGVFDDPRASQIAWAAQNAYLHTQAALDVVENVKAGNWDHRQMWTDASFDREDPARLVVWVNAGSCSEQPYCYSSRVYKSGEPWDSVDHEHYRASAADPIAERQPSISLAIDNPVATAHEVGHFFDDFSGAGVMGDGAPLGGCPPNAQSIEDCVPGCNLDTTDESKPLGESVANMFTAVVVSTLYDEIEYDENCFSAQFSGNWGGNLRPVLSPACIGSQLDVAMFDDTRPTDAGVDGYYCGFNAGYNQTPIMQAWWSLIYGKVCEGHSPWTCADIDGLPNPRDAALRALEYGLSASNHQWYKMFIENVGVYYACQYGEGVYADYVQVMSNHGLMDAGLAAPLCPDVCGDGIVGPNETCDDGNIVSGDGCSDSCVIEGGGGSGGGDGEPCEELLDFPGGTGLTNRPWGSASTVEEELYYHWCGADPTMTCVVENEEFICRECFPNKRPGCYCDSDDDCVTLGNGAQCYGPGLHGPEFGCFMPNDAPVYACEQPCQTLGKVCAWDPGEFMSGTCFNEYCLEPGPDFACERDPGVECFPEAELCYLPGAPACDENGESCDGGAGMCSLRWSGQVYECCHDTECLIPLVAS